MGARPLAAKPGDDRYLRLIASGEDNVRLLQRLQDASGAAAPAPSTGKPRPALENAFRTTQVRDKVKQSKSPAWDPFPVEAN